MMKNIFLVICIFIFLQSNAQNKNIIDTAFYEVSYIYKHMPDTAYPIVFREENMGLYIGKNINEYFSIDKEKKDSLLKKQIEESGGLGGLTINTSGKKTTATKVFYTKPDNKLIVDEKLIKIYIYEDIFQNIDWKITNEVKKIGDWNCTMATGNFRGRQYTAWFSTELSLIGAPWKLVGLPGLVLEAYDSKKEVQFLFAGIQNIHDTHIVIAPYPDKSISTTKKDFQKVRLAAQSDPIGFLNNAATESGSGFRLNDGPTNSSFKPKKESNPVELTDN